MILGLSDAETIVGITAGFFLLLALIVLARLTLRKIPPTYNHWRFGVFVEREGDPEPGDPSEQATESWPDPGVSETGRDR